MSKKVSLSVFIFVLIAAMLISFMAAFTVTTSVYNKSLSDIYSGGTGDLSGDGGSEKLNLLISLIKQNSYYNLSDEDLNASLINGFSYIAGDRYAAYYTKEEYELLTEENNGEMQGIGITIIENADYSCIEVISVMPDSPALEAGVEPGDLIVSVGVGDDSVSVESLGYLAAVKQLQGLAGTQAEFTVRRGDNYSTEKEFKITRGYVTSQSVTYHICKIDSKVGIIKLLQFDLTTPVQFCEAMDALIASGAEKFIFDVRYNGGGDLASITAVLSFMLNKDDIVIRTVDRQGNSTTTKVAEVRYADSSAYSACNVLKEDIGKYAAVVKGHSAVLVNGSTASAAELFTAALMDYQVSEIVGTVTYGKGSMQSIIPLSYYGSDGALKLTTKMYFPPLSDGYDGIGITPDVTVELNESLANINIYKITDEQDNQLQAAIGAIGK